MRRTSGATSRIMVGGYEKSQKPTRGARDRGIQVEHANDTKLIDELWKEIQQASDLDAAPRKHAIEAVAAKLGTLANSRRTAPLFFLLGYALYFHPDRLTSVPIQRSLEDALHSALS